ncbi:glycoside hydrolase family 32 protein [Weissella soli]|uniref:glycoside hydrolase family 32 protein n=1 Tax=Weissella soli TaxID=155866 RepID=UPI00359FEBF0
MMIVGDEERFEEFHIYPTHGLLNDPNGLVYFKDQYHVFYQWNPWGTDHKYKVWGHVVSDDLVNWHRLPEALVPSLPEDQSGIYSGSTIVVDDQLYAFYTGNVRNEAGESIASYQMGAVSTDGVHFTKLGKLFDQPAGFTRHVRDPKIFKQNDTYFLLLGAQRLDLTGDIIIYSSPDLHHWDFRGSLIDDQLAEVRGYMIECPDIAFIDGQAVLMFSPQGLTAKAGTLENIHNTGYVIGEFDAQRAKFAVQSSFEELDHGFEFYASQTVSHAGRTLLWGWSGMMPEAREQTLPTIADGWAHVLSLPREVSMQAKQLLQKPVAELGSFKRVEAAKITGVGLWELEDTTWQLKLSATMYIERAGNQLTMRRCQWESQQWEERKITGALAVVQLVIDQDIVEVFAGDGQFVMTARYF